MPNRPDLDVLNQILASVPQFIFGSNAFTGPVRPVDDRFVEGSALFALATAGRPDEPIGAVSLGSRTISKPLVTIRVRASKGDGSFVIGQELARAAFNAIDRKPPAGYCDARSLRSHPRYLGMTGDDGRHEWLFDVALMLDVRSLSVYWGTDVAGLSLEAEVLALANTERALNRYRLITETPPIGEKIYYWFPDLFAVPGTPTFTVSDIVETWATTPLSVDGVAGTLYERTLAGAGAAVSAVVT